MKNQEVLFKEIDLIQGCISRMAKNSFMLKGWAVSLIAVILALLPGTTGIRALCVISIVVAFCFWFLDSYYLRLERLFRWKYEWVIEKRIHSEDCLYNMNPKEEKMWLPDENGSSKKAPLIIHMMFSISEVPIYVTLLVCAVFFLANDFVGWIQLVN